MPHFFLTEDEFFIPAMEEADEEGLLIIGGRPTPARVLAAYAKGVFPWYNEDEWPLWWSPDPRFVLFPDELHISAGMKKMSRKNSFEFKTDTAFEDVITACASVNRKGQDGTWITPEMKEVYVQLYHSGYAHSAEAWQDGTLVGGMYGIKIGGVFFGESMFSKTANASKFAFIKMVQHLQQKGVTLIDAQVYTKHVETLGAKLIPRPQFLSLLQAAIK